MEGDVLGAASLLATTVAVLYSLWADEIASAMALDRAQWPKLANRAEPIGRISRALRMRAAPLALLALAQAAVFAPNLWQTVEDSWLAIMSGGAHYDAVRAAFLAVWATMFLLAGASMEQARGLRRQLADFSTEG
jgi:hypothetical protein